MSKKEDKYKNDINSILNNAGIFILSILIITIIICIHFTFGGFILYACKVAQSNILPTDIKCSPYTDNKFDLKPIDSNIFTVKPPNSKEVLSQKISFPYNEWNSKNMIIDAISSWKESPDSMVLTNYFLSIIENLLCFNYYAWNLFFSGINQSLNESLQLILVPFLIPILFFILLIANNIYLIYLWFEKMSWFFKKNVNNAHDDRKPDWKNISILEPLSYLFAFFFLFIFICLFFLVFWGLFPLLAMFGAIWTLLSLFTYKGMMENKEISITTIISKIFKYHKVTFMSIITFFIILSAFTNLGGIGGIICLIAALALIFGIVPSNLFIPEIPLNLSSLVSNNQAKKTCKAINYQQKHSFLYNILFPQRGGAEFVHEIKKIGKKLKTI
jgi:hypothetical protein